MSSKITLGYCPKCKINLRTRGHWANFVCPECEADLVAPVPVDMAKRDKFHRRQDIVTKTNGEIETVPFDSQAKPIPSQAIVVTEVGAAEQPTNSEDSSLYPLVLIETPRERLVQVSAYRAIIERRDTDAMGGDRWVYLNEISESGKTDQIQEPPAYAGGTSSYRSPPDLSRAVVWRLLHFAVNPLAGRRTGGNE